MKRDPQIHGGWRSFSVSNALEVLGATLKRIRDDDGLSWKEVGRILGKSDDRASDYANALSEMPVGAFLLGCKDWNGRFANPALALVGMKLVPVVRRPQGDRTFSVILTRLQLAVNEALENDDEIDDAELAAMQALLEEAGQAIDARRGVTL